MAKLEKTQHDTGKTQIHEFRPSRQVMRKVYRSHEIVFPFFQKIWQRKYGVDFNYFTFKHVEKGGSIAGNDFTNDYYPFLAPEDREKIAKGFDGLIASYYRITFEGVVCALIEYREKLKNFKNAPPNVIASTKVVTPEIAEFAEKRRMSFPPNYLVPNASKHDAAAFLILAGELPDQFWEELMNGSKLISQDKLIQIVWDKINENKDLVKVSTHLESQKPGKLEYIQYDLFNMFKDKPDITKEIETQGIKTVGLDLSKAENVALFALQKLLYQSRFKGNNPPNELISFSPWAKGHEPIPEVPRLSFSPAEYFEAYGVTKFKTGRGFMEYSKAESQAALRALASLATRSLIIKYERKFKRVKNKRLTQSIETVANLIKIYAGKEQIEHIIGDKVKKTDSKLTFITIDFLPLFFDQIENYFILKPANLHETIRAKFPKAGQFLINLIDYLYLQANHKIRTDNPLIIEIEPVNMAAVLRMDSYLKPRLLTTKIRSTLNRIYKQAKELGYLTDYRTTSKTKGDGKKDVLILNHDKFVFTKNKPEDETGSDSNSLKALRGALKSKKDGGKTLF
jgi:hypothetical protein